jgi:hypothetical protein
VAALCGSIDFGGYRELSEQLSSSKEGLLSVELVKTCARGVRANNA